MSIELFIFDEGGVMIRGFYVIPAMAQRLGLAENELLDLLRPDLGGLSIGAYGSAEFWRRFSARTGIVPEEDLFANLFSPSPQPGSFELVSELAATYRVVCGTNTIDCHHEVNLRMGMYRGFHAVYASHLIGTAKPDPEFWEIILRAEGVKAEHCFFIDDSEVNVEAARSLGMIAHRFTNASDLRTELVARGLLGGGMNPES